MRISLLRTFMYMMTMLVYAYLLHDICLLDYKIVQPVNCTVPIILHTDDNQKH